MLGGKIDPKQAEEHAKKIPGVIITDAKNVYDRLRNTVFVVKGAEKRIAVEMMSLKEAQAANDVQFRWVNSVAQLANSLTQSDEQHQLNHMDSGESLKMSVCGQLKIGDSWDSTL